MSDYNNDDLLYRNTLGVDGKRINYTKRVIKDGEVFYYKDDELIKTIRSDGSVTFKNVQGKNIINKKEIDEFDVDELTYYPTNDGTAYYSYLYKNGVTELVHEDSSGIIDSSIGGVDGSVLLENGTTIPKIVDYIDGYSKDNTEISSLGTIITKKENGEQIIKTLDGSIIEQSAEGNRHIFRSNIVKENNTIIYSNGDVDVDLSFFEDYNFINKLPVDSGMKYRLYDGKYNFLKKYFNDAKVSVDGDIIKIDFRNGYSVINDNGFIKIKKNNEVQGIFTLDNENSGIYYDNEKNELFYNDINISFLLNDEFVNIGNINNIVKEVDDGLEFSFSDGKSVFLKNNIVYNKNSDESIDSIMRRTGNVLQGINGNVLYNMIALKDSESINSDELDKFNKELEEYKKTTLTNEQVEQIKDVEKLERYYHYIDSYFGDELSFSEKLKYCKMLEDEDKNNYNKILYSTPIVKNGIVNTKLRVGETLYDWYTEKFYYMYSGEYLEFYNENNIKVNVPLVTFSCDEKGNIIEKNMSEEKKSKITKLSGKYYADIMKNSNNYSEKFRNTTNDVLQNIIMVYSDEDFNKSKVGEGWAGLAPRKDVYSKKGGVLLKLGEVEKSYDYMIDAYTHELGHIFTYSTGKYEHTIDYSKKWKNVYNQINENDSEHLLLSDYAHSSNVECFAESVEEYFSSGRCENYNSNDLKALEIDIDGYDNLYDYMTSILT